MNVIPLTNRRDWKWHRDRIASAWGKQVESIIETGQMLIEAKQELDHGAFEAMVQSKLPFGKDVAQRLMKIVHNPVLVKADHGRLLPPSYQTLYELDKLPSEMLIEKLKDGSINPRLERKQARAMRPNIKSKPKPRPPQPKPTLTLDELRERLVALMHDLPKEKRMREIERQMKALDLDIHDWVSTMTLGAKRRRR